MRSISRGWSCDWCSVTRIFWIEWATLRSSDHSLWCYSIMNGDGSKRAWSEMECLHVIWDGNRRDTICFPIPYQKCAFVKSGQFTWREISVMLGTSSHFWLALVGDALAWIICNDTSPVVNRGGWWIWSVMTIDFLWGWTRINGTSCETTGQESRSGYTHIKVLITSSRKILEALLSIKGLRPFGIPVLTPVLQRTVPCSRHHPGIPNSKQLHHPHPKHWQAQPCMDQPGFSHPNLPKIDSPVDPSPPNYWQPGHHQDSTWTPPLGSKLHQAGRAVHL